MERGGQALIFGADRGGEFEGVGALAAADIQHPHARLQAKTVQDQRFPGDYSGQFVGLVKKMKEKAGLGALVDTRETRDLLAAGHVHKVRAYAGSCRPLWHQRTILSSSKELVSCPINT